MEPSWQAVAIILSKKGLKLNSFIPSSWHIKGISSGRAPFVDASITAKVPVSWKIHTLAWNTCIYFEPSKEQQWTFCWPWSHCYKEGKQGHQYSRMNTPVWWYRSQCNTTNILCRLSRCSKQVLVLRCLWCCHCCLCLLYGPNCGLTLLCLCCVTVVLFLTRQMITLHYINTILSKLHKPPSYNSWLALS